MKTWQEDQLNILLGTDSETSFFSQIASIAKEMGFEYCAYGIRMPVPISRPSIAMFSTYPMEWQKYYQDRSYVEIDPTVQHGLKNTSPIVWSPQVFESTPELWEEAQGHGLQYGWAQASRDARGTIGLLTLARSVEELTENELRAMREKMAWLTQFAHAGMAELLVPTLAPETLVTMTSREREVLRWTAEGKTSSEIGQILIISERTVNFHINNVINKLGASNKTQAAVKAAALGMLY